MAKEMNSEAVDLHGVLAQIDLIVDEIDSRVEEMNGGWWRLI
jgi:hypothetical protein